MSPLAQHHTRSRANVQVSRLARERAGDRGIEDVSRMNEDMHTGYRHWGFGYWDTTCTPIRSRLRTRRDAVPLQDAPEVDSEVRFPGFRLY